jgi:hypothetical protein
MYGRNQQYIHIITKRLAFHALSDFIGEEN